VVNFPREGFCSEASKSKGSGRPPSRAALSDDPSRRLSGACRAARLFGVVSRRYRGVVIRTSNEASVCSNRRGASSKNEPIDDQHQTHERQTNEHPNGFSGLACPCPFLDLLLLVHVAFSASITFWIGKQEETCNKFQKSGRKSPARRRVLFPSSV
jgi:hypothetical protein